MTFVEIIDVLGVAVFAASGTLVASRKEMDLVGFGLMATLTGIGGGTIRDLILDRPVFWLSDQLTLITCLVIAVAGYFTASAIQQRYRALVWADAIGLSFFAVNGARIALEQGAGSLTAAILGIMTATFGGLARDIVAGEESLFLKHELYVTAAAAAAVTYVAANALGTPLWVDAVIGIAVGFILRGGAILRGWSLPRYRARPGRDW